MPVEASSDSFLCDWAMGEVCIGLVGPRSVVSDEPLDDWTEEESVRIGSGGREVGTFVGCGPSSKLGNLHLTISSGWTCSMNPRPRV